MADDPYRITNQVGNEMLDMMIERLEERARDVRFLRMIDDYLEAAQVDDARNVLDLGCGTGVVARRITSRPGFGGSVTGLDLGPGFIAKARELAAAEGLDDVTHFEVGDIRDLRGPIGGFDLTVLHTLVSHLDDPAGALQEAARVTRPGGRVVVSDGDYASATLETAIAEKAAEIDQVMIDATVTQPRVMRRLPRLARQAGLQIEAFFPYVIAEAGQPDFFAGILSSIGPMLVSSGVTSKEDAAQIVGDLDRTAEDGTFFGACNYYTYILRCA